MKSYINGVLLGLSLVCSGAPAQGLRDPTLAPVAAGLGSAAEPAEKLATPESAGMTVIIRQGQAFLASGNRLYARGQKMGKARIERISETEVWLREGAVLRKVPLFAGIQRNVVASQKSPTVAP